MEKPAKTLYYVFVVLITGISFFSFSPLFYPLLSSDDALNILIAHYYNLPDDLYCWGQDRGGTLIPLISQLFIKVFGWTALLSVSISYYLILIAGYFGFSSLFKTNYSKIIFAVVWFLPFQRFVELLRYPIGMEYSLIAVLIFFIKRLDEKSFRNKLSSHLYLAGSVIVSIAAAWVSDTAVITISLLLILTLIYNVLKRGKLKINKVQTLYLISGIALGFLFIMYAKSTAVVKSVNYLSVNTFKEVVNGLEIMGKAFYEVLTFKTGELFVSIYVYISSLSIITFLLFTRWGGGFRNLLKDKWIMFFLSDFLIVFAVIMLSSWVLANGMGRWYFVASYISFSMFLLLTLEAIANQRLVKIFRYVFAVIAITGVLSTYHNMLFVKPKTLRPMAKTAAEFKQLGRIGLIGDFWNSYIYSCPDPEMIMATPHDKSCVRNQALADKVFERENIYIIKDMWMESFPDTISQFGHVLIKDGEQFSMGGSEVCRYRGIGKGD